MTRCIGTRAKYRTRCLLVTLPEATNKELIDSISAMMLASVRINHTKDQPPLEEMRKIIEPAYIILAKLLREELFEERYHHHQLDKLHAEFNVTYGSYRLRFNWETDEVIQTFLVDVKPEDQKTLVTRFIEQYGSDKYMPSL